MAKKKKENKICLFCGKAHGDDRPKLCQLKDCADTALMNTFDTLTAMSIMSSSNFLNEYEKCLKDKGLI